jgi:hypothetical protein
MDQDASDNHQYKNLATPQLVALFEELFGKKPDRWRSVRLDLSSLS